jgi:cytidine kinase
MSLLVVGSIALDSVETPFGVVDNALGGSATYFSYAASYFTPVRLVGVVGEDFPPEHRMLLQERGIDTAGLVVEKGGATFRWRGKYEGDMNMAETLEVHLNVLGTFDPDLPPSYTQTPFVFLANGSPSMQRKVLRQSHGRKLAVADTMNFWIETQRDEIYALLREVDGLVMNDGEARLLTDEVNLVRAGRKVLTLGPKFVVIKKGEHGALFLSDEESFVMPAFPLADVVDPTAMNRAVPLTSATPLRRNCPRMTAISRSMTVRMRRWRSAIEIRSWTA